HAAGAYAKGERGARNIDERAIRDPGLVQQILEHEALVDDEVGCLVGLNTTLDACRRAILDGELVAARTLEFLAELGEDRGHVAGTQDLDVRGMGPRQRSKTNCQSQQRCTGERYPHRASSSLVSNFPTAPKLHGRTRAEKCPRRTSNSMQDAVVFGR